MESWWNSLDLSLQVFYGIAAIGTFALVLQSVLRLTGMHDLTVGDLHDGDHPGGLSLLSISSLVACTLGLGWGGVLALRGGGGTGLALAVGIGLGLAMVMGQYTLMRFLVGLRHDGSLQYANAIGATGTAYTPIPPHRGQGGQITVLCQGRLITAQAVQDGDTPLPTGSPVRVTALAAPTTFVVTPG